MIFKVVTELESSSDKNYFREKIYIYIKIVDALCRKYQLKASKAVEENCIAKLVEIGVISKVEDLDILKSLLAHDKYKSFIAAVCTSIANDYIMHPHLEKLNNSDRKHIQERYSKESGPVLVDLFCGAGGLSLGFKQAGFKTVFANDLDSLCIETYKYNHPEISSDKVVCGDIREISCNIDEYVLGNVDVVIGGPPCQGFSSANKRHRIIDDPRNELYKYFLKSVEKLAPKMVVMENVKGMLKVANQVVEDFENLRVNINEQELSYAVAYRLLNSADFSVAQSRERLIYIAIRSDIAEQSRISPSYLFEKIAANNEGRPQYNLSMVLQGVRPLIAPHTMNVGEVDTEEGGRKVDANPFIGNENDYLTLINEGREMPIVYNHKARYCSELNYEIYRRMNQGDDATDPKIADIMPYAHRNDKFKDKYFRLYADRPCRTITAHLRSDCHSHIHPFEARAITPREAARAQSFPDDYFFLGPYLKTYIQIGNAVPTLMARGIAHVLKSYLEGELYED